MAEHARALPLDRIAFMAAPSAGAESARAELVACYGETPQEAARIVVALGGDGFMLRTLHEFINTDVAIFGMNRGSVGFLMNAYGTEDLPERLARAEMTPIHPLTMRAEGLDGTVFDAFAFNEVSVLRRTHRAVQIRIDVDGAERLRDLVSDGVLLATPAGSTAYNLSAHGPILPLDTPLLALTPISPFRPRRWRGALLSATSRVRWQVQDPDLRTANVAADFKEFGPVASVEIVQDRALRAQILFDPDQTLRERILAEQFRY